MQLSPKTVFIGLVVLGLPFAVTAGWALAGRPVTGSSSVVGLPAGAGGIGGAPVRLTTSAPPTPVQYGSHPTRSVAPAKSPPPAATRAPAVAPTTKAPTVAVTARPTATVSDSPVPDLTPPPVPTPTEIPFPTDPSFFPSDWPPAAETAFRHWRIWGR